MAFCKRGISKLSIAGIGVACILQVMPTLAKEYPMKPIRLIVGFAPGGTTDTIGRLAAQAITKGLNQQVIVENRPGAASNLATELVSKSPADGYTLLVMTVTQTVNATLYKSLAYDIRTDFAPISQLVTAPHVLVVHPSVPVSNVASLLQLARRRPSQLNFANAGSGSTSHLAAALFEVSANIDVTHIPYKGTSPAITELIAGETQAMFSDMLVGRPHIISGRLKAIAASLPNGQRSYLMPDLPTISESGVPGFESGTWVGIVAPARTPYQVIDRLNTELVRAYSRDEFKRKLNELGMEVVATSSGEFATIIKKDVAKWAAIIRQTGLVAE